MIRHDRDHDRYREMLARRAELPPPDEADLRLHLRGCPECQEMADAYARQTALLRRLPIADPPPALRAGVLAALSGAAAAPVRGGWRPAFLAAPAGLAAAAVIALVLVNRPPTQHAVVAQPTAPRLTQIAPSPTPRATARPTAGKPYPSRHDAGTPPTAAPGPPVTNPGAAPAGTSVAVLGPTATTATRLPAPTASRPVKPGPGHAAGRPTIIPTVVLGGAPHPTGSSQPTVVPFATPTNVPASPPTPIRIEPRRPPTPTAVVIVPPTPTPSTSVAAVTVPTATPGTVPAVPSGSPPPAPTPSP